MKIIIDKAVRTAIAHLDLAEAGLVTLKDPAPRGSGRLLMIARRHKTTTSSEWFAQWYRNGKKLTTKLGDYPAMSVAEARDIFITKVSPAIQTGKNPTGPRAWVRNTRATVQDLFEAYLLHLAEKGARPGSIKTARSALLGRNGAAHLLGPTRPVDAITSEDIREVLRQIKSRGASHAANNTRAFLQAAFNYAIECKLSYHLKSQRTDWGIELNPVAPIPSDPAAFVPGDRYLSEEEFRRFWHWLTVKGRSYRYKFAPAMQLMMATGQRPGEILGLHRDMLIVDRQEILWPTTKNGLPHLLPMPDALWAIVTAQKPNEAGWLFPKQRIKNECAESYVTEWLIGAYLAESGAKNFSARDLRRTWKTIAGAAGLSKEIRDRLQNHAISDVSARNYDRYDYAREKRKAMDQWCTHLTALLTEDPDGSIDFARPVRVTRPPGEKERSRLWRQALKDGFIDVATLNMLRANASTGATDQVGS